MYGNSIDNPMEIPIEFPKCTKDSHRIPTGQKKFPFPSHTHGNPADQKQTSLYFGEKSQIVCLLDEGVSHFGVRLDSFCT